MFKTSVILNLSVSTEQPKCSDERKCKWQEIKLIISHKEAITPTIILITSRFSNSAKFHGTVKILRQRANSAAWLEIPWPTENCGP